MPDGSGTGGLDALLSHTGVAGAVLQATFVAHYPYRHLWHTATQVLLTCFDVRLECLHCMNYYDAKINSFVV